MIEPPLPPNPRREFDFGKEYHIGELNRCVYNFSDYDLEIVVSGSPDSPHVDAKTEEGDYSEALWTVVYWCYEYGIPGVCQETLKFTAGEKSIKYRLGALYRYAGFELTERETDYFKYGENPKTA
ncbi:MAG: hypothetical protein ABEH81_01115 [Halopenitus sp.]